jgi:hypothetical protein
MMPFQSPHHSGFLKTFVNFAKNIQIYYYLKYRGSASQISATQYKISQKKYSKKISRIFHEVFHEILFGYRGSAANLGYACKNFWGGSRPAGLGGDRPRTNSSKPKTQINI